jgi:hypothetical protein
MLYHIYIYSVRMSDVRYQIHLYTNPKQAYEAVQTRGLLMKGPRIKHYDKQLLSQCGEKAIKLQYLKKLLESESDVNSSSSSFWLVSFSEGAHKTPKWLGGFLVGHVHPKAIYIDLVCSKNRQGYKLINAAIHMGASLGSDVVQLNAVPDQIAYYRRIGFQRHPNACKVHQPLAKQIQNSLKTHMGHATRLKKSNNTEFLISSYPASTTTVKPRVWIKETLQEVLPVYTLYKDNIGPLFYTYEQHNNGYIMDGVIMSLCIRKSLHRLAQLHNAVKNELSWNNPSSWHHIKLNNLPYYYSNKGSDSSLPKTKGKRGKSPFALETPSPPREEESLSFKKALQFYGTKLHKARLRKALKKKI